jgi:hypothetical protein
MGKYNHISIDGIPLTEQERFVLEQAEKGEPADLKARFGEAEENRSLRARYLVELLSGELMGVVVHRRGIMIGNAVVSDPLDLQDAEVSLKVGLKGFTFQGPVTCQDACFKKHLNLSGSKFSGIVDCQRLVVEGSLFTEGTTFEGPVDLSGSQIRGLLWAVKAKFIDPGSKANFNGLKVGQNAFFVEVEFHGAVEFRGAEIGGQMAMQGARFLGMGKDQEADFNSLKVGESAFFDGSEFHLSADFSGLKVEKSCSLLPWLHENKEKPTIFRHSVTFAGSDVRGQFQAENTKFQGKGKKVNFNGLKVGQDVYFKNAEFQGPVDFVSANVERSFTFESVHCNGQGIDNLVSFNGIKVNQDAFFHNSFFYGPVVFVGADIGRQFSAKEAQFIGEDEENQASFNAMKVGQNAFFDHTLFKWQVDFSGMHIGRQFSADGAQFNYPDSPAIFHRLKVEQDAYFRGASFQGGAVFTMISIWGSLYLDPLPEIDGLKRTKVGGSVNFGGGSIGGQFLADSSCFGEKGDDSLANFNGLSVGQEMFFKGTIFEGRVHICYAHLLDVILEGNPAISEILLEDTRIGRKLEISKTTISKFHCKNLDVKGPATLREVNIPDEADFRYSSFQVLNLHDVNWPQNREKVFLEGLTYQAVSDRDGEEGWWKLLDWVKGSRFNTQNYSQLEAYFSHCGHRGRADEVFISGKREAAKRLTWGKKWLTRIFWGGLAGYGRKPWQVLYVILPLVALGTFLFAPEFTAKSLESYGWLNQMKPSHPWIIQFLLSLDRFLPGVDLGLAKEWSPVCVGLFSFVYWYFLKLAGWITIPIALAAIYTRIK